jgi:uncharacterized protein YjiS (DUF1127 family)
MLNPFKMMADYLKSYSRYYRAMCELSSLTDRELADIGLRRSDIPLVSMNAMRNTYSPEIAVS